jgi:hypothetical protein
LIDRFDFPATDTLKRPCITYHVTKPDVLTEHPVKLLFKVRFRHIVLLLLGIVHNCGT